MRNISTKFLLCFFVALMLAGYNNCQKSNQAFQGSSPSNTNSPLDPDNREIIDGQGPGGGSNGGGYPGTGRPDSDLVFINQYKLECLGNFHNLTSNLTYESASNTYQLSLFDCYGNESSSVLEQNQVWHRDYAGFLAYTDSRIWHQQGIISYGGGFVEFFELCYDDASEIAFTVKVTTSDSGSEYLILHTTIDSSEASQSHSQMTKRASQLGVLPDGSRNFTSDDGIVSIVVSPDGSATFEYASNGAIGMNCLFDEDK